MSKKDKKNKNRIAEIAKKIERDNNFRKILKNPKKFQEHLEYARDAYIATGAFLDEEGRCDSILILEEIMRDLRLAAPRYDFDTDPELFVANMADDRTALQNICKNYARSDKPARSRKAKKKAQKFLEGLKLKNPIEGYLADLDAERKIYLNEKRKERDMRRIVEKAREAEKKYWKPKKPSIKREMSLNRIGKFIDGSDAKKEFLENRVRNHFAEGASLGIKGHKLQELTMYFNLGIEESNDGIVASTKDIMRDELAKLGVQKDYVGSLMAKFDSLRKEYQEQKMAFYAAFNSAAVRN